MHKFMPNRFQPALLPSGKRRLAGVLLAAHVLAGCAGWSQPAAPDAGNDAGAAGCARWFQTLDDVTRQAGVGDGSAHRLADYPFLRSDRFLASFGEEVAGNSLALEAWVSRLAELDRHARALELGNLPLQFVPLLSASANRMNSASSPATPAAAYDKQPISAATRRCAGLAEAALIKTLRAPESEPERRKLAAQAQVPDDYSAVKRAFGLYPLTRQPFFSGVRRWQQSAAEKFLATLQLDPKTLPVIHYRPAGEPVTSSQIAEIYAKRQPDVLGMARLSTGDEAALLRAYAPDLQIETGGDFDRFGPLLWAAQSPTVAARAGTAASPTVDIRQPVMYQRLAYTRHHGQTLLQLVYSVWFPERPLAPGIDLLGGKLDSVALRLTLAPDGTPWLYDSIHSCGCYHLFFTTPGAVPRPAPRASVEWAFVPATLPALAVGQRVVMRLSSGSHYVEGLQALNAQMSDQLNATAPQPAASPYTLMNDQALQALPVTGASGGVTRSAFWPHGIVPGTERGERLLFWPMGIDSAGAMRQWGRQPTAFVGRRHFDDADLLQQRFDRLQD